MTAPGATTSVMWTTPHHPRRWYSPLLTMSDGVSRPRPACPEAVRPKVGKLSATTSGNESKSYDKKFTDRSGRYDITVIELFLGSPNASGGSDANGEMAPVRHNGRLERCEEPGPFRLSRRPGC